MNTENAQKLCEVSADIVQENDMEECVRNTIVRETPFILQFIAIDFCVILVYNSSSRINAGELVSAG